MLCSIRVSTGALCSVLDVERLEESHENYQDSRKRDMEANIGKKVGSLSIREVDIVQEGRTRTVFKYIKGCYKELGRNIFSVLVMDRARYSRFKHGKNNFNVKALQHWNRFS